MRIMNMKLVDPQARRGGPPLRVPAHNPSGDPEGGPPCGGGVVGGDPLGPLDDSDEFDGATRPESLSCPFSTCSLSMGTYVLIPICVILDLLAIWYRQTFLYMAAVSISVLFCCKSSCWASLLIVLQCFVGIYYHVFVMDGVHVSLKVGGLQL